MSINARQYTIKLLEKIDEGLLDAKAVVEAFTRYCSEDEVHDMMKSNGLLEEMCVQCDNFDELDEDGICEDCQEENERIFCDSCEEELSTEEYENNRGGLCNNCIDHEAEEEERVCT